jgi:lysine 2,3-aminomutase
MIHPDNWKQQLKQRLRCAEDFHPYFTLRDDEKKFFSESELHDSFAVAVTPYYLSLADPQDPRDPVRNQFMPSAKEFEIKEYESYDPLSEKQCEVAPGLIHRYRNRVLLRVTNLCAVYCRHCYRRGFQSPPYDTINGERLDKVLSFLSSNSGIDELLLSGGDPLILDDEKVLHIIDAVRSLKKKLIIRLCTRIPVVLPQRITRVLCRELKKRTPLWIVTQFNHRQEITDQSTRALSFLTDAGFPVLNQTVLLKGINDSEEELYKLFSNLVILHVKPYYLFQGDLAAGTSHFRVSLEQGLALYRRLKVSLSGITLPFYAVDLPDGGGKVLLTESSIIKKDGKWYCIKNYEGKSYYYPAEK